ITAYAAYAAATATNPQKKSLIGASPSRVGRSVHPDLGRGGQPQCDGGAVTAGGDGAGPWRDLDDRETAPGSDLVAPEVLEQLLVGFGLLGDALHDDGGALLGLRERERLDARPPRAIRCIASVTAGAEIDMCLASRAPITGLPLPARS